MKRIKKYLDLWMDIDNFTKYRLYFVKLLNLKRLILLVKHILLWCNIYDVIFMIIQLIIISLSNSLKTCNSRICTNVELIQQICNGLLIRWSQGIVLFFICQEHLIFILFCTVLMFYSGGWMDRTSSISAYVTYLW